MIKIGSRESKLAVLQAEIVMRAIRRNNPGVQTQLITMKTTGDMILDRTLDQIGGKGLFVKELDRALLDGKVDMTVHSFKDMPMETDERLPVVAASPREDPRDALILPQGTDAPDPAKPIGCASARRTLQLKRLFRAMPFCRCGAMCKRGSKSLIPVSIRRWCLHAPGSNASASSIASAGFLSHGKCFRQPAREFSRCRRVQILTRIFLTGSTIRRQCWPQGRNAVLYERLTAVAALPSRRTQG